MKDLLELFLLFDYFLNFFTQGDAALLLAFFFDVKLRNGRLTGQDIHFRLMPLLAAGFRLRLCRLDRRAVRLELIFDGFEILFDCLLML